MLDIWMIIKEWKIALFGSPDYTAGNKAQINRRMKLLMEVE